MMKRQTLNLALGIFLLGMTSCINESLEDNQNKPIPTTVGQLVASDNFSWKTSNNIDLTLIGSNNMMVTVLTEDGKICFKGLLKNEETLVANLILKSSDQRLKVVYGPATKSFDINSKSIICNFNE